MGADEVWGGLMDCGGLMSCGGAETCGGLMCCGCGRADGFVGG